MITLQIQVAKGTNGSWYIPIPTATADRVLKEFGRRITCEVSGKPLLHCALLRSKTIGHYIMLGKSSREKLAVEFGDQLTIHIRKDKTKYQAEVPEELQVVLSTDPEAAEKFEALTDGKKRSIIHYVNRAKQSDTRINRALKLVDRVKMGVTNQKDLFAS